MWKFSFSFHIMALNINCIVAVKTIKGGKLFKGGNYLRKYGTYNLYMAWLDQDEMMAWLGLA